MAAPHINYESALRFVNITSNTDTLMTNCTAFTLENKGELGVSITVEDTVIYIKAGEGFSHSCDPDVIQTTVFTNLVFDEGVGEKMLFVTKEFITPVNEEAP